MSITIIISPAPWTCVINDDEFLNTFYSFPTARSFVVRGPRHILVAQTIYRFRIKSTGFFSFCLRVGCPFYDYSPNTSRRRYMKWKKRLRIFCATSTTLRPTLSTIYYRYTQKTICPIKANNNFKCSTRDACSGIYDGVQYKISIFSSQWDDEICFIVCVGKSLKNVFIV